jgi:hypothetical protein
LQISGCPPARLSCSITTVGFLCFGFCRGCSRCLALTVPFRCREASSSESAQSAMANRLSLGMAVKPTSASDAEPRMPDSNEPEQVLSLPFPLLGCVPVDVSFRNGRLIMMAKHRCARGSYRWTTLACALPCVSWVFTSVDPPAGWFSETSTVITILRPKVKASMILSSKPASYANPPGSCTVMCQKIYPRSSNFHAQTFSRRTD